MSLNPYSFLLEKLFHDPLRRKKKTQKGIVLWKITEFCHGVCFLPSSSKLKLCHWPGRFPTPLCLSLLSFHMPVWSELCVLWMNLQRIPILVAVTPQGLCLVNFLILFSYLSSAVGCAEASGLGCWLQAMKVHVPENCGPNCHCLWIRLPHHQSLVSISFHLQCLLAP